MKKILSLSFATIVAIVTIYILIKKPPVNIGADGFPVNPKEGDKFTKDSQPYEYKDGQWVIVGRPNPNGERSKGGACSSKKTNPDGTTTTCYGYMKIGPDGLDYCDCSEGIVIQKGQNTKECIDWTLFNPVSKDNNGISFRVLKRWHCPPCIKWEKDSYIFKSSTQDSNTSLYKICEYSKI